MRVFLLTSALAAVLMSVGGCGSKTTDSPDAGVVDAVVGDTNRPMCAAACDVGQRCCVATGGCVAVDPATLCEAGLVCDEASITIDASCTASCASCTDGRGILATYLDLAASDSSLLISGYSNGRADGEPLGDLVVGRATDASSPITWETVDGVPAGPGWRGGSTDPADDVGRWSSIVAIGSDVWVASYDATHGALRIAHHDGAVWSSYTLDDEGDAGRYASLVVDATGRLAVAYAAVLPGADADVPFTTGRVMVARASATEPSSAADWSRTTVSAAAIACTAGCAAGEQCFATGGCRAPSTDCLDPCTAGLACSAGECSWIVEESTLTTEYPLAAAWTRLAATSSGLAVIWHDGRAGRGVLRGASLDGSIWSPPFTIEGQEGGTVFGNSGNGADIAVDALDRWHVSFVDDSRRRVRYALIEAGVVTFRATVDDGSADLDGVRFPEGAHRVGGSTSISLDENLIRIAYQDQSAHDLRVAERVDGSATGWAIVASDRIDYAGLWPSSIVRDGASVIVSQWRADAAEDRGGVRFLSVE